MDALPSNIIFDIFSRIPDVKCLVRLRCVSKRWCEYINDPYLGVIHGERAVEEPATLIMFHQYPTFQRLSHSHTICFHTLIELYVTALKPKKIPHMQFAYKKPSLSICSADYFSVHHGGSCNGLVYISLYDCKIVTVILIDLVRKQFYELPPLGLHAHLSFGLGFDASSNTYKTVCVSPKSTMVHAFGTQSWQQIPQVPPYPVQGEAIFVESRLYWLVSFQENKHDSTTAREVIWFDLSEEEFGLINPPPSNTTADKPTKRKFSKAGDHLVNLNGQVGYMCNRTLEVWVLQKKKKNQKLEYDEWALYCRIDEDRLPNKKVKILGCRNKDGDIVITATSKGYNCYYVYYVLKSSGVIIQQFHIRVNWKNDHGSEGIVMYSNSLLSVNQQGINKICKPTREKIFGFTKISCPSVCMY